MLVDTSAWLEYFQGTSRGRSVRDVVDGGEILYTTPIILAELTSKSIRTDGVAKAEERVRFVLERTVHLPMDDALGIEAGRIHADKKRDFSDFGLADAFIQAAANARGIKVLSFDPHLA